MGCERDGASSPNLAGAVVVVTGVMAAGKSTVAQELAERLPYAAHVRGDTFRRMVVSGRAEPVGEPAGEALRQLRLRYRLAAEVADGYADAGFAVVLQDIVLGSALPELLGTLRTRPRYVVALLPDPTVVAARAALRAKTSYTGADQLQALDLALRRDTPRLGLWLDTSSLTVEQTVGAVLGDLPAAEVPADVP